MKASPTASGPGQRVDWSDDSLARQWRDGDNLEPLLQLPRRMAASLIGAGECQVRKVVDVGSGPGAFLEAVLRRCPEAEGVWTDVSEAMQATAAGRLGELSARIEFGLLAAADLPEVGAPASVDAVVTSRLTHHLPLTELRCFYVHAYSLLRDGGWIANLDHVAIGEPWSRRLAEARSELVPPNPSPHRHERPLPTLDDHLAALGELDGLDVVVAWRAFSTVLIMARRR